MKRKYAKKILCGFCALFCVNLLMQYELTKVRAEVTMEEPGEEEEHLENTERLQSAEKEKTTDENGENYLDAEIERESDMSAEAEENMTSETKADIEETKTDTNKEIKSIENEMTSPDAQEEEKETGKENTEKIDTGKDNSEKDLTEKETIQTDNSETEETHPESIPEKEAQSNFSVVLRSETEEIKAGETLSYEVILKNTGETVLSNLELHSIFAKDPLSATWEEQEKVHIQEETGTASLEKLEPEEEILLKLHVQIPEEMTHPLEHTLITLARGAENDAKILRRDAQVCTVIVPLTVGYEVEKTADHGVAYPGDSVMYTITIRNTGERTLHSIISTEHFVQDGVQASFLPAEGILLNKDRTKAYIAKLEAGAAISLRASVVIPASVMGQELINQVYVTTKETGTEAHQSEATIQINEPEPTITPEPTTAPYVQEAEDISDDMVSDAGMHATSIVQTGDLSQPSRWIRISAASLLLVILITAAKKAKR